MTKNNFYTYAPKIVLKFIWEIIYFPLWWYTVGLFRLLKGVRSFLHDRQVNLGVGVWLKNIFTPMYGQRDFISRLISFIVRLFQVIFRGLAWLLWLALCLIAILVWLLLPALVVYMLVVQLFL